jgi:ribose transport system substrate-binding protein
MRKNASRLVGFALAAALIVTACTSDSEPNVADTDSGPSATSSDSPGATEPDASPDDAARVDEARSIVAEAEQPVTQVPPGPPFDASVVEGSNVWFVSLVFSIDYAQQVWQGVQQGAEALGVEVKSFDGQFSPAEVTRGIDLAIQDQADAIIVHSLPSSVVAPALQRAKEAGIALISAEVQNPGPPLPDTPAEIDAIAGHSYSIPTRYMAAMVVADSGGDANVMFFSADDIGPGSAQGTETFVDTMNELCPNCEVEVLDSPLAQWAGLSDRIASLLRGNPEVNYVVPIFDGMAVNMVPGIRSASATERVKIVTGDATASVLEQSRSGEIVIGDVGQPNAWTGVAIMDQTARVLADVDPLEDVGVPYRLFTSNNVEGLDLTGDPTGWYGNVDFLAEYRRIWGLE